jgi:hypothetical protein
MTQKKFSTKVYLLNFNGINWHPTNKSSLNNVNPIIPLLDGKWSVWIELFSLLLLQIIIYKGIKFLA